ncbi:hypothetical protein PLESTB_001571200 [Pleodorina starrii]|uniref:Uncharacterized protein n=1 Tax=Pleodorina starrii TaxID=330485 RepID=A0A9W6BYB3_9CHLO|nr:hypothetical protein PLESTB_001571200 [Pleodorina starrii]
MPQQLSHGAANLQHGQGRGCGGGWPGAKPPGPRALDLNQAGCQESADGPWAQPSKRPCQEQPVNMFNDPGDAYGAGGHGSGAQPTPAVAPHPLQETLSGENEPAVRTDDDILAMIGLADSASPRKHAPVPPRHGADGGRGAGFGSGGRPLGGPASGTCSGVCAPPCAALCRPPAAPHAEDGGAESAGDLGYHHQQRRQQYQDKQYQQQPGPQGQHHGRQQQQQRLDRPRPSDAWADLDLDLDVDLIDPDEQWAGSGHRAAAADATGHGGGNAGRPGSGWARNASVGVRPVGGQADPVPTLPQPQGGGGWSGGPLTAASGGLGPQDVCRDEVPRRTGHDVAAARRRWGLEAAAELSNPGPAAGGSVGSGSGRGGGGMSSGGTGGQQGSSGGPWGPNRGAAAAAGAAAGWKPSRSVEARAAARVEWDLFGDSAADLPDDSQPSTTAAAAPSEQGAPAGGPGGTGLGLAPSTRPEAAAPTAASPGPTRRGGGAAAATAGYAQQQPHSAGLRGGTGAGAIGAAEGDDGGAKTAVAMAGRVAAARARWNAPLSGQGARGTAEIPMAATAPATSGPSGAAGLDAGGGGSAATSAAAPAPHMAGAGQWTAPRLTRPAIVAAASGANRGSGPSSGGAGTAVFGALVLPPLDQPSVPQRLVAIPARFSGPAHYRATMVNAMVEEINLRLAESVQQLYGIVRRLLSANPAPAAAGGSRPGCGPQPPPAPAQQQWQRKQGGQAGARSTPHGIQQRQGAFGQQSFGGPASKLQGAAGAGGGGGFVRLPPAAQAAELERACQAGHVPYFASCTLTCWVNREGGGSGGGGGLGAGKKKRGRGGGGGGVDEEDDEADGGATRSVPKVSYYLIVPSVRSRLKNTRRHDLWIVSSHPLLQGSGLGPATAAAGGGASGGWRVICRSLWHGPDRDGKFEVEMLTAPPPGTIRSQAVYALRGPDTQSEVQLAQLLGSIGPHEHDPAVAAAAAPAAAAAVLPLLRHLLSRQPPDAPLDLAAASAAVAAAALRGGAGEGGRGGFKRPRVEGKIKGEAEAEMEDEGGEQGDAGACGGPSAVSSPQGGSRSGGCRRGFDAAAVARAHIARFRLNGDQAAVLLHCASWFKVQRQRPQPPSAAGGRVRGDGAAARSGDVGSPSAKDVDVEGPLEAAEGQVQDDDDDFVLWQSDDRRIAGGSMVRANANPKTAVGKGQRRSGQRRVIVDEEEEVEREAEEDASPGGGSEVHERGTGDGAEAAEVVGSRGVAAGAPLECQPPVCLVHGPFGSGKSSLLVALILMLVELGREQQRAAAEEVAAAASAGGRKGRGGKKQAAAAASGGPPPVRVLLASHTNVAVDRVLIGLQDAGFTDFLRLGSVDRIAKPVLHRSLRSGDNDGGRDTATELRRALKDAASPTDVAYIQAELSALAAGAEKQRRKALHTCPVVGATVCSLLQPSAEDGCGGTFTVVVLDECSQMTEPLCLVPLLRARARFLVAAGDPLQLPPVIANPANLTGTAAAAAAAAAAAVPQLTVGGGPTTGSSLSPSALHPASASAAAGPLDSMLRPMFVRLSQLGHQPHLLSYQYRCHPLLSGIANAAFYGGRLRDGCAASDRSPLLPGLPTLLFVEVAGQAQVDGATRSSYNMAEAHTVARAVAALLECGVEAEAVGVICFYRAQVAAIRRALQAQTAAQGTEAPAAAVTAGPTARGTGPVAEGSAAAAAVASASAGGERAGGVQVATVDSFQGAEKEVVFLATTVSRAADFAADAKRLNVALTRGRRHLLVVGAPAALSQTSAVFQGIIRTCQDAMRTTHKPPPQQAQLGAPATRNNHHAPGCALPVARQPDALYISAAGLHHLLSSAAGVGASGHPPQTPECSSSRAMAAAPELPRQMPPPQLQQPQQGFVWRPGPAPGSAPPPQLKPGAAGPPAQQSWQPQHHQRHQHYPEASMLRVPPAATPGPLEQRPQQPPPQRQNLQPGNYLQYQQQQHDHQQHQQATMPPAGTNSGFRPAPAWQQLAAGQAPSQPPWGHPAAAMQVAVVRAQEGAEGKAVEWELDEDWGEEGVLGESPEGYGGYVRGVSGPSRPQVGQAGDDASTNPGADTEADAGADDVDVCGLSEGGPSVAAQQPLGSPAWLDAPPDSMKRPLPSQLPLPPQPRVQPDSSVQGSPERLGGTRAYARTSWVADFIDEADLRLSSLGPDDGCEDA